MSDLEEDYGSDSGSDRSLDNDHDRVQTALNHLESGDYEGVMERILSTLDDLVDATEPAHDGGRFRGRSQDILNPSKKIRKKWKSQIMIILRDSHLPNDLKKPLQSLRMQLDEQVRQFKISLELIPKSLVPVG